MLDSLCMGKKRWKTNTVGFVLLQKPAALNLHSSSHTLPQVRVGAEQDWSTLECMSALFALCNEVIIGSSLVHHKVPYKKCASVWVQQAAAAATYYDQVVKLVAFDNTHNQMPTEPVSIASI